MNELSEQQSDYSVVIPCYNDDTYLSRAIDSTLSQTVTPNEVIVIDDGSTDNTKNVVNEYGEETPVQYHAHEANKGLPAARNTGIRLATGKFIAFLDADDEWVPTKIEQQLQSFRRSPEVGMVYSDFYKVTPEGERFGVETALSVDENFVETLFVEGGSILPSSAVVRTECFEQVGTFDECLHMGQERDFWLRIGTEFPVEHVSEPLVCRRVRPDSLASNYEEKYQYEQMVTEKMVELNPSLKPLVNQRRAHLLYNRSSYRLTVGDATGARADALRSIRQWPWIPEAYLALASSCLWGDLPSKTWQALRTMKSRGKNIL